MGEEHGIIPHGTRTSRDAFDIIEGDFKEVGNNNLPAKIPQQEEVIRIISENPAQLISMFDLTQEQAENVASIMAGSGAGLAYKYLNRYLGGEISSMLGALIGSVVARKLKGML